MAGAPDHAVLYDADCGFCTRTLDRIMRWDRRSRLRGVPIQSAEGARLLADVPAAERLDSWHLVLPGGEVRSAGAAVPPLFRLLPFGGPLAALAAALPSLTAAGYRWIAAHREQLGRLFTLALVALVLGGCGTTVQDGSELTVYVSVPRGDAGAALLEGAEEALADRGGEVAGVPVAIEPLRQPRDETAQVGVASGARAAAADSAAIAYIGELEPGASRFSVPITNGAGFLQLVPAAVPQALLGGPGAEDVPDELQTTGARTVGALGTVDDPPPGDPDAELRGQAAMEMLIAALETAADPLGRRSVVDAFLGLSERESVLGTYTIDPRGAAAWAGG